jgi:hypothetical protein
VDYVETAESICPNVSAAISHEGCLLLLRHGRWTPQICPYQRRFGVFKVYCNDKCPKFSDVYAVEDIPDDEFKELSKPTQIMCLEICGSVYTLDCFTDFRGKDSEGFTNVELG